MNLLKNIPIGRRLGLAFGALLLLLCAITGFGVMQLNAIQNNVQEFATGTVPALRAINDIGGHLGSIRRLESQHMMVDSAPEMDELEARIEQTRAALKKGLGAYERMASDDEDKRRWAAALAATEAYVVIWDRLRPLSRVRAADHEAAVKAHDLFFGESRARYRVAHDAVTAMWKYNEQLGDAMTAHSTKEYQRALVLLAGLATTALLLGIAASVVIARSIIHPIAQTMRALQRMADGDLGTAVPPAAGRDEAAMMIGTLRRMQGNLVQVIGSVREGADSVSTASAEIAQGNADLSQRTEEQASALQETAASMEQLGSTVRQNADNARQASQLAQGASSVAQQGGAVVARVVDTMKDINGSSRQIVEIISVIDGIAFQTNILALNAAVEAARAGEQGRGFAVVAGEVRSLAQRSAEAAREVKALITASVERVEQGSTLVDQAGSTMKEIVASIGRVTDIVGEISAASTEQASGVGQIGEAVNQMDQATQQNAALVEESAAAAESLRHQAQQLSQAVSVFKLAQGPAVAPALKPAVAKAPAVPAPATKAPKVTKAPAAQEAAVQEWEAF